MSDDNRWCWESFELVKGHKTDSEGKAACPGCGRRLVPLRSDFFSCVGAWKERWPRHRVRKAQRQRAA